MRSILIVVFSFLSFLPGGSRDDNAELVPQLSQDKRAVNLYWTRKVHKVLVCTLDIAVTFKDKNSTLNKPYTYSYKGVRLDKDNVQSVTDKTEISKLDQQYEGVFIAAINNVTWSCEPECIPKSCPDLQKECGGPFDSGCGTPITCPNCPSDKVCDANGKCQPKPVTPPPCTPKTCQSIQKECGGPFDDGCGKTFVCNGCTQDRCCDGKCCQGTQTCFESKCCTPQTCTTLGKYCGKDYPDGCGGKTESCGLCSGWETCDQGKCSCKNIICDGDCCSPQEICSDAGCCRPRTCNELGYECGHHYDLNCLTDKDCGNCESHSDDDKYCSYFGQCAGWKKPESVIDGTFFSGIFANSDNDIWVTATSGSNLWHFDGQKWYQISILINNQYMTKGLSSIISPEKGVIFVTDLTDGIYKRKGNEWTQFSKPFFSITALWGDSENELFASTVQDRVYHYSGNGWSQMIIPAPNGLKNLYGLNNKNIWGVNFNMILHYDGSTWVNHFPACCADSEANFSVVFTLPGDVWVGGHEDYVMQYHYSGGGSEWQWKSHSLIDLSCWKLGDQINAIFGLVSSEVWFGTNKGAILLWDGTKISCQMKPLGGNQEITAFSGRECANIHATINRGKVIHFH